MNSKIKPLVSIVINNYNYGSFLQKAIDSALGQTYPRVEVVIVDDGSTDCSREIIESYCDRSDRIIPVLKVNGGQASSINAGVEASSGDILCFLDADDIFHPHKVEMVVDLMSSLDWENNILLNNFLEVVDKNEAPVKVDLVKEILSDPGEWRFLSLLAGNPYFFLGSLNRVSTPEQVYKFAAKYRFIPYLGVQTSGITMTKSLAIKVFPLPEKGIKISADVFLVKAASLQGIIYSTSHILTQYRVHGSNHWYNRKSKSEFSETEKFFLELDSFLNMKLANLGKDSVFSYLNSMVAKSYYRHYFGYKCHKELLSLAFKVFFWHIDLITINFFIKTILLTMYFRIRCSLS